MPTSVWGFETNTDGDITSLPCIASCIGFATQHSIPRPENLQLWYLQGERRGPDLGQMQYMAILEAFVKAQGMTPLGKHAIPTTVKGILCDVDDTACRT